MKVAILHAYSPRNSGDGLLVQSAIRLVQDALGEDTSFDLFASRARDFSEVLPGEIRCISTRPSLSGYSDELRRSLRALTSYDLVVGVGGGYLRFGSLREALKTWLVHVPQLSAAARLAPASTIYLPQSIGPSGPISRRLLPRLLSGVDVVMLRDDRSMSELDGWRLPDLRRIPDCALLDLTRRELPFQEEANTVIGTRALRRDGRRRLVELSRALAPIDGLVQSSVGGNDDRHPVLELEPSTVMDQAALAAQRKGRVVVSVRLHGALMALAAGHYAIHLAYERKGFGAFADAGLQEWVHNAYDFDVDNVREQVVRLRDSADERSRYDEACAKALGTVHRQRAQVVMTMRQLATGGEE